MVAHVLHPTSKRAINHLLNQESSSTMLKALLGLKRVDEDHWYEAMDTLVEQKSRMECAWAKKHLDEGSLVLYDTTSRDVQNMENHLYVYGYNKDKKKGKHSIVINLMTDSRGSYVSVKVFLGNPLDTATLGRSITNDKRPLVCSKWFWRLIEAFSDKSPSIKKSYP